MIQDTSLILILLTFIFQLNADQWFNVFSNREFYGTTVFSVASCLCLSECLLRCNRNGQCLAVMYDGQSKTCTGLSDEGGLMIGKVNTGINTGVKENAWITGFIGQAGIGKKVYPEWTGGSSTSVDSKYDPSCNCHYKSELVEKWATVGVKKIKLSVLSSNTEVAYLVFDGNASNKISWFSAQRVLNSSWTDVKEGVHNIFSIIGHIPSSVSRRFYISSVNDGCSNDFAWLGVTDGGLGCNYETGPRPLILYSASSTMVDMNDGTQVKRADRFIIYFQQWMAN